MELSRPILIRRNLFTSSQDANDGVGMASGIGSTLTLTAFALKFMKSSIGSIPKGYVQQGSLLQSATSS